MDPFLILATLIVASLPVILAISSLVRQHALRKRLADDEHALWALKQTVAELSRQITRLQSDRDADRRAAREAHTPEPAVAAAPLPSIPAIAGTAIPIPAPTTGPISDPVSTAPRSAGPTRPPAAVVRSPPSSEPRVQPAPIVRDLWRDLASVVESPTRGCWLPPPPCSPSCSRGWP